jgi:putative oxidoreductase
MRLGRTVDRFNDIAASLLSPLQHPFLLLLRVYVSWQFLKSGWLKLQDWESTQFLFEEEYKVPVVSPAIAAVAGTAGEIVFPVLLIVGLLGRYAAFGLSAVNVVAVVAYAHVLRSDGFEAAIGQHYLWGLMLLTVLLFGPGRLSVDAALAGRGTRVSLAVHGTPR